MVEMQTELDNGLEYPTVKKWLNRVAPSTKRTYANRMLGFLDWLRVSGGSFSEMSPDELVEYQRNSDNSTCFDILELIQAYVGSLELRYSTLKTCYAVVKSFFAHNRVELPNDPGFIIRSDHTPVLGTLSVEEIRDMVMSSNETYRAVILSIFQGALDLSGFDHWNRTGWESLKEQLRGDPDFVRIDLPGRKKQKNNKPFYTFIARDAIDAIVNYLPIRPESGDAIFYSKDGDPVSKHAVRIYWMRHLKRLGLIPRHKTVSADDEEAVRKAKTRRYGKNPHEMRDVFRSQWEKSPAKGSVAEFLMGHQVDPLEYNKAFRDEAWTLKEYKRALPMLQLMSSGRPFGQVEEYEVETLSARVKELEDKIEKDKKLKDGANIRDERLDRMDKDIGDIQKTLNEILSRLPQ